MSTICKENRRNPELIGAITAAQIHTTFQNRTSMRVQCRAVSWQSHTGRFSFERIRMKRAHSSSSSHRVCCSIPQPCWEHRMSLEVSAVQILQGDFLQLQPHFQSQASFLAPKFPFSIKFHVIFGLKFLPMWILQIVWAGVQFKNCDHEIIFRRIFCQDQTCWFISSAEMCSVLKS